MQQHGGQVHPHGLAAHVRSHRAIACTCGLSPAQPREQACWLSTCRCGTNVARGSAFESAVLEHRRLLPDQANTVPFVALGAHLLRCNPSNHTRPYALQSCMYLYGQCAVDVCECMPAQLYAFCEARELAQLAQL